MGSLCPENGWEEGIVNCWNIYNSPHESFRNRHDYASRLLWLALPFHRQSLLVNTLLGDLVIATAEWWLAEHGVHSLQRRLLNKARHGTTLVGSFGGSSLGPEPALGQIAAGAEQHDGSYPTQEDVRAWKNAFDVRQLWQYLTADRNMTSKKKKRQAEEEVMFL